MGISYLYVLIQIIMHFYHTLVPNAFLYWWNIEAACLANLRAPDEKDNRNWRKGNGDKSKNTSGPVDANSLIHISRK